MSKRTIKEIRKASNYNQQQIADAIGLSKSLYQKIEQGERNIKIGYLVKFALFFKISIFHIKEIDTVKMPEKSYKVDLYKIIHNKLTY